MIAWVYPLIILAAIGVGASLLRRSQSTLQLSPHDKWAIGISAFCGAMLGAKLPFALSDWEALRSGTVWFSNGKTILSGLVGAYLAVELTKWIYGIRTKTGDTFAVPAAVTVSIGRLGCFAAGCCYGTPTDLPWGIQFELADGAVLPRHPTQLYESAFHLTVAFMMAGLHRRGIWRGQLMKFYILSYLLYRFATEYIRPEPELWWGLTSYQWFALAIAPVFAFIWWSDLRHDTVNRIAPHSEPASTG